MDMVKTDSIVVGDIITVYGGTPERVTAIRDGGYVNNLGDCYIMTMTNLKSKRSHDSWRPKGKTVGVKQYRPAR